MRGDDVSDSDKATFAVNAWIESTVIEEALDAHTCGCDQAFLFQGKEFLFMCVWCCAGFFPPSPIVADLWASTRMCISNEFRRFIPHPESYVFCSLWENYVDDAIQGGERPVQSQEGRGMACVQVSLFLGISPDQACSAPSIYRGETYDAGAAHSHGQQAECPRSATVLCVVFYGSGSKVYLSLVSLTVHTLTLSSRSLKLWQCDNTLVSALEVCQAFFPPIDYLSCLWPCPGMTSRVISLVCFLTGVHSATVEISKFTRAAGAGMPYCTTSAPSSAEFRSTGAWVTTGNGRVMDV